LLGCEATTSFISLQRQLPGVLAAPSNPSVKLAQLASLAYFPLRFEISFRLSVNAPCALAPRHQTAMPFALGERSLPRG